MILHKLTDTQFYERAHLRAESDEDDRPVRPHPWTRSSIDEWYGAERSSDLPMIARTATRPRSPARKSTGTLLSPEEFERSLTRECSLADRGTRVFTLLVLRNRDGHSEGWTRFAPSLCDRLRSTDLVARMDAQRVSVLLSDTGEEGAAVVAGWIDLLVAELGIRIDPTIYVYPSQEEALRVAAAEHNGRARVADRRNGGSNGHIHGPLNGRANGHVNGHANGHTNGHVNGDAEGRAQEPKAQQPSNGHTNGHVIGRIRTGAQPSNGSPAAGKKGVRAKSADDADAGAGLTAACWQVEDLWNELSRPLPAWKRGIDIFASALALVLLLPLFIVVAIAVRLDSPGPAIFRQTRAGRGARAFAFYKFRTMFVDAEKRRAELEALNEKDGPIFKIHDDPRITRVGRLLRRWSIDELPQLWNILIGDISLVGPRSPLFNEVAQYERWQRRRLSVTGGITCIWQVSGRSQISFREWMRMDMQYVRSCSLWTDLCLLARTVPAVLSGRGAY